MEDPNRVALDAAQREANDLCFPVQTAAIIAAYLRARPDSMRRLDETVTEWRYRREREADAVEYTAAKGP